VLGHAPCGARPQEVVHVIEENETLMSDRTRMALAVVVIIAGLSFFGWMFFVGGGVHLQIFENAWSGFFADEDNLLYFAGGIVLLSALCGIFSR
jgi:hypothetical protein